MKKNIPDSLNKSPNISPTETILEAVSNLPRQRNQGAEKAYPTMVKSAIEGKQILHCNHRGIVALSCGREKPSLSVEELLENRRRGVSYASLGRSYIGIDPSKDEVLNVFRVIREVAPDIYTPVIEGEEVTTPKQYPTPLWYIWKSETDNITKECTPKLDSLLSLGLSARIFRHLGDDTTTKLAAFIEVSDVLTEDIGISFTNVDKKSIFGKELMWSNNLQAKVTHSCSQLMIKIGKSVLQQSPNSEATDGRGRCRCGATKLLKCSWHGGIHPSFFLGM